MKRCPGPDLLIALDEGVLPEALESTVREHLSGCAICQTLQRDLRSVPFAEPTAAGLQRVRRRVLGERVFPVKKAAAVAAGVILAVSLFVWRSRQVESPAAPVAERKVERPYRVAVSAAPLRLPFAAAMVLRGKSESPSQEYLKELGKALDPYRAGSYGEADLRFGELRRRYPQAVEAPFYQGVARLLLKDSKGALESLTAAQKIGGEALNDDIGWYLAAAFERNDEWGTAVPLLQKLCVAEGLYRATACAALKQ